MIVPKRKTSKQRKRLRKSQDTLKMVGSTACRSCSKQILPHTACMYCGFYKNQKVRHYRSLNDRLEAR